MFNTMLKIIWVGENNLHFETNFYFTKRFYVHKCLMSFVSVHNTHVLFSHGPEKNTDSSKTVNSHVISVNQAQVLSYYGTEH